MNYHPNYYLGATEENSNKPPFVILYSSMEQIEYVAMFIDPKYKLSIYDDNWNKVKELNSPK